MEGRKTNNNKAIAVFAASSAITGGYIVYSSTSLDLKWDSSTSFPAGVLIISLACRSRVNYQMGSAVVTEFWGRQFANDEVNYTIMGS